MESKYLLEIDEYSFSYIGIPGADEAARRLGKKCAKGDTIVRVQVKNPRYKLKD